MFYKKLVLFTILFFLVFTLYGIDYDSYGVIGGVMYIRNSSDDGAPSPVLPFLGINAGFSIKEKYFLEPSIVFNWNYYLWSETEEMALPAEIEYADSVVILNIIVDCPFVMRFKLVKDINIAPFVSPAFIFRVPLKTWGEGDTYQSDILSYFYGGRFLFFEVGAFIEWNYSQRNSFKARIDTLLPVFHIWDGDSFTDQFSIRLSLTFSFITKSAQQRKIDAAARATETGDSKAAADSGTSVNTNE